MFSFLGNRKRRAAEVNAGLEEIKQWSKGAWRDHWHASPMLDLQTELDDFLPTAMARAQSNQNLQGSYTAMITRFILLGVGASQTHELSDFETTLGVPMPIEVTP